MKVFLTGGAGFIGRNFVERLVQEPDIHITVFDAFTYAVHTATEAWLNSLAQVSLIKGDVRNYKQVEQAILSAQPDRIVHMAAESHVDRSIEDPSVFVETNIGGTFNLLQATRIYLESIGGVPEGFLYLQVSTDEVYGPTEHEVDETAHYNPSSPYAASKAAADQLVNAWAKTYQIPASITFSTNNYGPWQNVEKFIPKILAAALNGEAVPVYGDGLQCRDWLYVYDHIEALLLILRNSHEGRFNISTRGLTENIKLIDLIEASLANTSFPCGSILKRTVPDRVGHDFAYRIDNSKSASVLGWKPSTELKLGIGKVIEHYVEELR